MSQALKQQRATYQVLHLQTYKIAHFRYDSKCNVRLHWCDMFLGIVDMHKDVMFISVQVTAGV